MKFQRGDRVKLTEKVLASLPTKWCDRRGVVACTPRMGGEIATIRWDDMKSTDSWPQRALEHVKS